MTSDEKSDVLEGLSTLTLNDDPPPETSTSHTESPTTLNEEMKAYLSQLSETLPNPPGPSPRVYVKLLVSNAAAGSIIGKGGTNINSFQQQTYARMQLSKSEEYFPGTSERTLLITGNLNQVIAALNLVFSKLVKEGVAPISPRFKSAQQDKEDATATDTTSTDFDPSKDVETARLMVKLLVPQPLCGIVIGKSGTNIKQTSEKTSTAIRLLSSEGPRLPLTHKIFLVSGTPKQILKAVAMMMLKQCQDPKYLQFSELHATYIAAPTATQQQGPGGMPHQMAALPHGSYYVSYAPIPHQGAIPPGSMVYSDMPSHHMAAMQSSHSGGGGHSGGGEHAVAGGVGGQGGYYQLPVLLTDQQVGLLGSRMGASMIEQVEASTATSISLHRESRRLNISGGVEGVQMAHYYLNQRLALMLMQQQAYMGGGGGAGGSGSGGSYIAMPASPSARNTSQQYYGNGSTGGGTGGGGGGYQYSSRYGGTGTGGGRSYQHQHTHSQSSSSTSPYSKSPYSKGGGSNGNGHHNTAENGN